MGITRLRVIVRPADRRPRPAGTTAAGRAGLVAAAGVLATLAGLAGAAEPGAITATSLGIVRPVLIGGGDTAVMAIAIDVPPDTAATLTELAFSLDGTDDLADIESLTVFATGADASFAPRERFGAARAAEATAVFRGTAPLAAGRNVFWLACRLRPTDDLDHRVAAACTRLVTTAGEVVPAVGPPQRQRIGVAVRRAGDDGVHTHRIPALAASAAGTLLCVYDMRRRSSRDLQEDIDIGLSRSTDGGRSWEPARVIMDMGRHGGLPPEHNGCSDPGIIVDPATGEIFVFAVWMNGKPGKHQWVGDGSAAGFEIGQAAQFMAVRSRDDGRTWSKPENLTRSLKRKEWWLLAPAPSQGICLPDGTLVMPVQGRDGPGPDDTFATIMTSRDHGESWTVAAPACHGGTECQAALTGAGAILLNVRNDAGRFRLAAVTDDLGATWRPHSTSGTTLIEPGCHGSLLRVDRPAANDRPVLLFANSHSQVGRTHQTIQVSFDDGMTWPRSHHLLLDDGRGNGYPCLARIDDDHVGIVYEGSQADLVFERIPLAELVRDGGGPRRPLVIAHHMNAEPPTKAGGQNVFGYGSNTPTPPRISPKAMWSTVGGRLRDMSIVSLVGADTLSEERQMAWEVAVAQRAGIDAFAFYGGIPGGIGRVLGFMRAARGTGFKITLCSGGGERGDLYLPCVDAMKQLLEADRELDVLLRLDGRLVLLSYGGNWGTTVEEMTAKRRDLEVRLGTPLAVMYMPSLPTAEGPDRERPARWPALYEAERERLGGLLRGGFDGLSPFVITGDDRIEADARFWADLCRAEGRMYFQAVSFQFHSPLHMTHAPVADSIWRRSWEVAGDGAAGVQLVTWNDWGETTALAPGMSSNYGLYDMLRDEIATFKAGRGPGPGQDRAWAMYYRYPSAAEPAVFHAPSPRRFRGPEHDRIWVRTLLAGPAVVECAGRGREEAPAGRGLVSFPLTPGPVRITITRGKRTILTLEPPEHVTSRPWRPDHALCAFASDDVERAYRAADFPAVPPRYSSEYGDDDGDGLLNWFEGLYFSTLERPATLVGPDDDFNGTPCREAQERFLDPVMPPPRYPAGFVWSTRSLPEQSVTPAPDANGVDVWRFGHVAEPDQAAAAGRLEPPRAAHQARDPWWWILDHADGLHRLRRDGRLDCVVGSRTVPVLQWVAPVAGRVRLRAAFALPAEPPRPLEARVVADPPALLDWREPLTAEGERRLERDLEVEPGTVLAFFAAATAPGRAAETILEVSLEMLGPVPPLPSGDKVDPPIVVDLAAHRESFATAVARNRWRWGEAGLRHEDDGLAIFNPGDQNSRFMAGFLDSVPNPTYGPLCRFGTAQVAAEAEFAFGGAPPASWGGPSFGLLARVSPQRERGYFLRVEPVLAKGEPAALRVLLGRFVQETFQPPRSDVFADAQLPLPPDGRLRLFLAAENVSEDTVRLTGRCSGGPAGGEARVSAERSLATDGVLPWGEVGFDARLHEFPDTPEAPRHVLLRSFSVGPIPAAP